MRPVLGDSGGFGGTGGECSCVRISWGGGELDFDHINGGAECCRRVMIG